MRKDKKNNNYNKKAATTEPTITNIKSNNMNTVKNEFKKTTRTHTTIKFIIRRR